METTSPRSPELSLQQRIWGVFVAPRVVFSYLDAHPRILGAILVLLVVNAVAGVLISDVALEQQRIEMESQEGMTPEQMDTALKIMRVSFPVVSALGPLFYVFVVGAIYLFIANILLQGSTTYRHMTSALAHISMITIPMAIVRVPLILIKRDVQVQTSLAAFLPQAEEKGVLFYALGQVEIFSLWMLWLAVLAVALMAKIPVRRAAYGLVGAFIVWSLIWVPLAPKFGG